MPCRAVRVVSDSLTLAAMSFCRVAIFFVTRRISAMRSWIRSARIERSPQQRHGNHPVPPQAHAFTQSLR